jgi:hypothetical protein
MGGGVPYAWLDDTTTSLNALAGFIRHSLWLIYPPLLLAEKGNIMNTRTGDIIEPDQLGKYIGRFPNETIFIKPMILGPTEQQLKRKPVNDIATGRIGRNDKCPCNSGKKFKKCCLKIG